MIRSNQISEKEYRNLPVDSASTLKEFSIDRRKYYKKYFIGEKVEEEFSNATTTGSLVDCLLLQKEEFDNKFYLSSITKAPSGNMEVFVNSLLKYSNEPHDSFEEIAKKAYKDSGYKLTFEKVLERFVGTDNEIFFKENLEIQSRGLVVVTLDQVQNAEKIVEELKNNFVTKDIINLVNSDRYIVQNQVQVDGFEIDGLPLKGMIDKIIIDKKNKTIQPYDLKCVWSVENFTEEYYLYRRAYIQAYVYKEACYKIKEELGLEYFHVENPSFIVCDSINYYNPLIYVLNQDDMEDAYNGFEYKDRYYPGVKEIIEDLKWSKEHNIWNISKSNYTNNGIVSLK